MFQLQENTELVQERNRHVRVAIRRHFPPDKMDSLSPYKQRRVRDRCHIHYLDFPGEE